MKQKFKNISAWVLQVLVGLEFILAGQAKFTDPDRWAEQFEGWGFPNYFYLLIGGLELVLAILVFFPKYSAKAAIGLGIIMLGAAGTHAIHQEWDRVLVTMIITGVVALLYFLRRDKWPKGGQSKTIPEV